MSRYIKKIVILSVSKPKRSSFSQQALLSYKAVKLVRRLFFCCSIFLNLKFLLRWKIQSNSIKLVLIVLFLSLLTFSCDKPFEKEAAYTNSFSKEISVLKSLHKAGLGLASDKLNSSLSLNTSGNIVLNEKNLLSDVLGSLNGSHFSASNSDINSYLFNFGSKNLSSKSRIDVQFEKIDIQRFYNENQRNLAEPFVKEILNTEDFSKAKILADNFQDKILSSKLSHDEKVSLLSLSTSFQVLSEFINEGGDEKIRAVLNNVSKRKEAPNARVAGCSVNARSVLSGAVIGFFGGGAAGAMAGCAGGTVALPLVGTAAGCVGGAVFGAAGGFVGGVVSGIASELMTSCAR